MSSAESLIDAKWTLSYLNQMSHPALGHKLTYEKKRRRNVTHARLCFGINSSHVAYLKNEYMSFHVKAVIPLESVIFHRRALPHVEPYEWLFLS